MERHINPRRHRRRDMAVLGCVEVAGKPVVKLGTHSRQLRPSELGDFVYRVLSDVPSARDAVLRAIAEWALENQDNADRQFLAIANRALNNDRFRRRLVRVLSDCGFEYVQVEVVECR